MSDSLMIAPFECLESEESFDFYKKFNSNKELQIAPNQDCNTKKRNDFQISPDDEYEEIGFNFK